MSEEQFRLGGLSSSRIAHPASKPSGRFLNCAAQVNQSTAAVLDQSTAAVLACNQQTPCQYVAVGHGTMVMGVIHLVAPAARSDAQANDF